MALLNRFLRLLQLLERLAEGMDFLSTPEGGSAIAALLSYQAFLMVGCDAPSAAILASASALTLHCAMNRPKF